MSLFHITKVNEKKYSSAVCLGGETFKREAREGSSRREGGMALRQKKPRQYFVV